MTEIWKPWPTNPKYTISSYGKVKGQNGRLMKTSIRKGYETVSLRIDKNQTRMCSVHRLVAETFLPDFDNDLTVDHINGIKTDNNVNNLCMVSRGQNTRISLDNNNEIYELVRQAINILGYDETKKRLKKIME